jgi:penicillin-binding protein A
VNAPLRRAGVVVMVLFGLLFANLNYVQAYKADEYRTSDYNGRVQVAEYDRQRGNIEAGGTAVAIDPRTGAVQALVSMPSFDPNPLASHDTTEATAAYAKLEADADGPLKNRALSETLPPGSTFKVVMGAVALESGIGKETSIPAGPSYTPPTSGTPIRNAVPSICPESEVTLIEAMTESCNTGFAQLGVKVGAEVVKEKARQFGFEQDGLTVGQLGEGGLPVAPSRTGTMQNADGGDDPGALAQSSIGQRDVRMTPLQGAMIAATVANGGKQMEPYVVRQLLGPDRTTSYYTANPKQLREPVTGQVANDLRDMMVSVVQNGTGRNARISGATVGGKTGTAQAGEKSDDHGWFIGFAIKDGQPVSAVCVMLESAGSGGSAEAARISGQIMRAVIADPGGR